MRSFINFLVPAVVLAASAVALAQGPSYKLGRTPSREEIKAWDIAVGPDGKELPPGSGTAKEGAKIFAQKCAVCHGPTGAEGSPIEPHVQHLVGGQGTIGTAHEEKTIGSFWPFATTIWDYINRAMPLRQGGSLKADEVYALTAVLLYRNKIIKEDDVIDAKSLPKIQMPNRYGFLPPLPLPEQQWNPKVSRPAGQYP
jgi:S-disulfanyl-L-cysteine oxidoreductase SoxD